MFLRILLGLAVSGIGFLFVWKSEKLYQITGQIDWAERNLSGGTRSFLKLFGMGIILIGFAIITNLITNVLEAFAGLFVRGV